MRFFLQNSYFRQRLEKQLIERYRSKSTPDTAPLTFTEFVRYLVDPTRTKPLNEHWLPQTQLCVPCFIEYDYIGHVENIALEAKAIIKNVFHRTDVVFPNSTYNSHTKEKLEKYWRMLPDDLVRDLKNFYKDDFRYFSYGV